MGGQGWERVEFIQGHTASEWKVELDPSDFKVCDHSSTPSSLNSMATFYRPNSLLPGWARLCFSSKQVLTVSNLKHNLKQHFIPHSHYTFFTGQMRTSRPDPSTHSNHYLGYCQCLWQRGQNCCLILSLKASAWKRQPSLLCLCQWPKQVTWSHLPFLGNGGSAICPKDRDMEILDEQH